MTLRSTQLLVALSLLTGVACAGPPIPHEPDVIDVTLSASSTDVRMAVIQVLTDDGYEVEREDDQNLTTSYRKEISGPWDGLLHWRFGTGRSRIDAFVTPTDEHTTRLRLHVQYDGKDGIFTRWEDSSTPLPQSAQNQLRLIKNALHIL